MLDDVRESTIERNQHTAFVGRRGEDAVIGNAVKLLIPRERHIVTGLAENCPNRIRNILIELDRRHDYAAGIGTMVSRASSAAYASAAGIASFGRVG